MSSGSPRVIVPDRRHVAAWVAGDAARHGEVSRYADSSEEDGEWDSIGTGGMAACMMEEEAMEPEDLEDHHFSFFDASGLHGTGWKTPGDEDRSLRSIGRDGGAVDSGATASAVAPAALAAAGAEAVAAAPTAASAHVPVAAPKLEAEKSESTPSAAVVAAAAARVRVAAASKVGTVTQPHNVTNGRTNAATRGSKDLEERERRARAAEARLREQAKQQAAERAGLAEVQAKVARLRAAQQEQAAAAARQVATVQQTFDIPVAAAAPASSGARPESPDVERWGDGLSTASTPPRHQAAAKRGPTRPPPDSPLRTSTLESKFLELQQAVRATPPRKKSFAVPQRHQTSASGNDISKLRGSVEFERQGTAVAKEAWREASAEEAGWAKELQQVRAAIKAAEAEEAENNVVSERPTRSPQEAEQGPVATTADSVPLGNPLHLRRVVQPTDAAAATPATRDEAAEAGVKWSDVGTPAEVLEKKLRKYRAKMNSPELTTAKRNEYLSKIRHYSAKASELGGKLGPAERSSEAGADRSSLGGKRTAASSADSGLLSGPGPSALPRKAGQQPYHSVRAQSSALVPGEPGGWKVGDRCHAGALLGVGTIRFVGQCLELAKGKGSGAGTSALWAGVELDLPRGKHDGKVRGQRYFQCQPQCGVLLKLAKLRPLS